MQKSERQCAELQKRSQAVLSRTFDQQEVNTFEQIVQEKNHFAIWYYCVMQLNMNVNKMD